jgi:hypothetical protein
MMIQERNGLLMSSNFRALPDYSERDKWLNYRQKLRDLPEGWTVDTPFPTPPI